MKQKFQTSIALHPSQMLTLAWGIILAGFVLKFAGSLAPQPVPQVANSCHMQDVPYPWSSDTMTQVLQTTTPNPPEIRVPRPVESTINWYEIGVWSIKAWESFERKPYICPAGKWTIGFGHLIAESEWGTHVTGGKSKEWWQNNWRTAGPTVSAEWCHATFARDVDVFKQEALKHSKDPNIVWALTSFSYNVGWSKIYAGRSTSRALKAKDWKAFSTAMLQYVNGGGRELPGLVARRKEEARWMKNVPPTELRMQILRDINNRYW